MRLKPAIDGSLMVDDGDRWIAAGSEEEEGVDARRKREGGTRTAGWKGKGSEPEPEPESHRAGVRRSHTEPESDGATRSRSHTSPEPELLRELVPEPELKPVVE